MKGACLQLGGGMSARCHRDAAGRYFVGYRSGTSRLFATPADLRRFLVLAPGTPSRLAFDSWIKELDQQHDPEAKNESPD